jgi:peptidoglycan/LPS O-acetylase OafA/YrhL
VLLALIYHQRRDLFDRFASMPVLLGCAGLILALAACTWNEHVADKADASDLEKCCRYAFVPAALFLGYGGFLIAAMRMPTRWFEHPVLRAMVRIGFYSYPIYLWHVDAANKIVRALAETPEAKAIPGWLRYLLGSGIYILFAILVGVLMSKCIEVPCLALRDRLFPRRSEALPVAAAVPVSSEDKSAAAAVENPVPASVTVSKS